MDGCVCPWRTRSKPRLHNARLSYLVIGWILILVSDVGGVSKHNFNSKELESYFSKLKRPPPPYHDMDSDDIDEISLMNLNSNSPIAHHRSKRAFYYDDHPPRIVGTWRDGAVCTAPGGSTISAGNYVDSMEKLQNCSVIEGNLEIKWMTNHVSADNYTDVEFPKLLEITGYLLFYRVEGLNTLGQLFPNLRVIRGLEVFYEYSLVLYENKDITSISLPNLHYLGTSVVAMINPQLCYISDHVDWSHIIATKKPPTTFSNRVKERGCDLVDGCSESCNPQSCWDMDNCQKVCDHCKTRTGHNPGCDARRNCCHEQCLGGCEVKDSPFGCYACKTIHHEGECLESCPNDGEELLEFEGRRCVNKSQCLDEYRLNKFHDGKCLKECPQNWIDHSNLTSFPEDERYHVCVKCDGTCDKVCKFSKTVQTAADSERFRGCTIVNGFLEIAISNQDSNLTLLDENFASLREVVGYVKIVRSPYIRTLNFLKNLRIIRGINVSPYYPEGSPFEYALYVMDNDNLVSLWNFNEEHPLTIENGRMFIQINKQLCISNIRRFLDSAIFNGEMQSKNGTMVKITADTHDDYVISDKTNGQFGNCFENSMFFELKYILRVLPSYNFSEFNITDKRRIISYVIYYREVEENEVAEYYRSGGGYENDDIIWKQHEVKTKRKKDHSAVQYYSSLMPYMDFYTRYAAYVQTFTTMDRGVDGTRSEIIYFTTKQAKPQSPEDILVTPVTEGENVALEIKWDPPTKPNGIIEKYLIHYRIQPWRVDQIYRKKFCDGVHAVVKKEPEPVTDAPVVAANSTGQCNCQSKDEAEPEAISEKKRLSELRFNFENYLQNRQFVKNPSKSRNPRIRRELDSSTLDTFQQNATLELTSSTMLTTTTAAEPESKPDANVANTVSVFANQTSVMLFDLEAQMEYSIEVEACQAYDKAENATRCSKRAVVTALTQPNPALDVINSTTFTIQKIKGKDGRVASLNFSWEMPPKTNGPILTFVIAYRKVDDAGATTGASGNKGASETDDEKWITICINAIKFINGNNSYVWENNLQSGAKYYFKVRMSTVGTKVGNFTTPVEVELESLIEPVSNSIALMIALPICLVIIISFTVVSTVCYRLKKKKPMPPATLINTFNQDYLDTENMYVPDDWEVERSKVKIGISLGQGSFGMVYEGEAKDLPKSDSKLRKVAIKTVNDSATIQDHINFLNEASRMKAFECHHIVQLLGVVSQGQPVLVIMELMSLGDLKNYLRMHRPDEPDNDGRRPPTLREILQMAAEIADGMAYLSDRKFVHRDLAARNCMVAHDMTVKIGDFGMTRDIYDADYYRKGGKGMLPVRWMAPESLRDGVYTSKSDVWSYGVVLWEMATLAAQPYQGFSNEEVLKFVMESRVMEMPDGCPTRLFDMMSQCWEYYPRHRPSFACLLESLQGDVKKTFFSVSWYYSQREDNASDAESDSLNLDEHSESQPLHPGSLRSSVQHLEAENDLDDEGMDDDEDIELGQSKNLMIDLPPPIPLRLSRQTLSDSVEEFELRGSPLLNGHDTGISSEYNETDGGGDSLCSLESPLIPNGGFNIGIDQNQLNHSKAPSSVVSAGQPPPSYTSALDQPLSSHDTSLWSTESNSKTNSCNGSASGHIHYGNNTLTSAC